MALKIETFSSLKGGNSFFKAVTHPAVAEAAAALVARLGAARRVALYDPLGFAAGFAACRDLSSVAFGGAYVQAVGEVGRERLGMAALPVTALPQSGADLVFVAAFDAEKLVQAIAHLIPAGAVVVTLDAMRLEPARLTNPRAYLDPLNFATNFAFFRDGEGQFTRIVTANYWSGYGATRPRLDLILFGEDGQRLAAWSEPLAAGATITIDSRSVRARFGLGPFRGQLFLHVVGAAGHDVVKYALDTGDSTGPSLSCTHDANAWPADFYAGLPAPRVDEQVVLWLQNSLPVPIPAGEIALNRMGGNHVVAFDEPVPPFATRALDVASLLPDLAWPDQIEITAGRYIVRPRYEIRRGDRLRIAHPNVERTDLKPEPEIAGLGALMGKGFILPAPILPPDQWQSLVLPTPMARSQASLPIQAVVYDPAGREIGRHRFGRLDRAESVALDLDQIGLGNLAFGHVELLYDFDAGNEADGWLHALFRYEGRQSGHTAETSFGAHIFNTTLTWRDEPQSYAGRPPGLTTRLFLRLGPAPTDTLCHLIYPASTPWHPLSTTELILTDAAGAEIARESVAIPCGGSLFWRASERFGSAALAQAEGGHVVIRDTTCRLFGYHGLIAADGRFSLDHMFGF